MRLRVRVHLGDTAFFDRVAASLTHEPGIRAVRVNPHTASILVEYDGDEAAILAGAKTQRLFETAAPVLGGASAAFGAIPPSSSGAITLSKLDLAAAGLTTAGVLQLLRGQVVGSASENLWNAYGLYTVTQQAPPSIFLVAVGLLQIVRGEVLGSAISLFLYAFSARRMAQHQPGENAV